MAAMVVSRWAYEPFGLRHKVVSMMIPASAHTAIAQPIALRDTVYTPRVERVLWRTGVLALEHQRRLRIDYPTQLLIRDGIQALHLDSRWRWYREGYERDYSWFYAGGGNEILRARQDAHGRLNPAWIGEITISAAGSALLHGDGTSLTTTHLATLGAGTTIGDYVEWTWQGTGKLRFQAKTVRFPLSNDESLTFRMLCDTIVANCPTIIFRPDEPGRVRAYNVEPSSGHVWNVDENRLLRHTLHDSVIHTATCVTQRTLQQQQPFRIGEAVVRPCLETSPRLVRLNCLWSGDRVWQPKRRPLKRYITAAARTNGASVIREKEKRWQNDDDRILAAFESVQWPLFLNTPGISVYDAQLWHRLRLRQLRTWDPTTHESTCPRDDCSQKDDSSASHVFWGCDAAARLWSCVASLWGAARPAHELCEAIFSRKPPAALHAWLEHIRDELPSCDDVVGDRLKHWTQVAWAQLCTCAIKQLWYRRVQASKGELPTLTNDDDFVVRANWTRQLRQTLTAIARDDGEAKKVDLLIQSTLYKALGTRAITMPRFLTHSEQYLLFFDGGSRGNPGPGGSGAVVVRLSHPPAIVWAASMSYASRTTTNNLAEYMGLRTGLSAVESNRWFPVSVVGDSMMIITQLRERRRPRSTTLLPHYVAARTTADRIQVISWKHHYRSSNKMADKAANQAMDTCTSYQSFCTDERTELSELTAFLNNDIHTWYEAQVSDGGTSTDPADDITPCISF